MSQLILLRQFFQSNKERISKMRQNENEAITADGGYAMLPTNCTLDMDCNTIFSLSFGQDIHGK